MDQLFHALPRDLQWEILSEFVGSHSVRNGKLIKKIIFDEKKHQMLEKIPRIQMSETRYHPDVADLFPNSVVNFSNGTQLSFTMHPELGLGLNGYLFISNTSRSDIPESMNHRKYYWVSQNRWYCNGDYPFVKRSYQSYPDTSKKRRKNVPHLNSIKPFYK